MPQVSKPVCRGCSQSDCDALGKLPDWNEFAGLVLPTTVPGGALYRCRNCDLVFRSPILTINEYGQLYASASGVGWAPKRWTLRNDQALIKQYIEAQFPEGAKILDIGCYTGEFLYSLPAKYEKFGIEKSISAVRECLRKGIRVVGDDLYDVNLLTERFDVVIAMDVIEHVFNPDQFLRSALNILSDRGILLITTGDSDNPIWLNEKAAFWYCAIAEHISFISERWLKSNSNVNNFLIVHLQKFKYENRQHWKTFAMRRLTSLYQLFGLHPHPMWTAHASEDHLFAALRRRTNISRCG